MVCLFFLNFLFFVRVCGIVTCVTDCNLLPQPSLVALALLALAVTEQQEAESVEALRDAVKDLQLQLTVSHVYFTFSGCLCIRRVEE